MVAKSGYMRLPQVFLLSQDVLGGCRFKKVEERTFTPGVDAIGRDV